MNCMFVLCLSIPPCSFLTLVQRRFSGFWGRVSLLGGSVSQLHCKGSCFFSSGSFCPDLGHTITSELLCCREGGLGDTGGHMSPYPGYNTR